MKTYMSCRTVKAASGGRSRALLRGLFWLCLGVAGLVSMEGKSASPLQVLNRADGASSEKVQTLAFSPDGKVLAVGSSAPAVGPSRVPGGTPPLPEGTIELWELNSGKLSKTLRQSARTENGDMANRVGALSFSPDGKWLVGGDLTGYTLWEVGTGREKFRWRKVMASEPLLAGWSPDGKWLALPHVLHPGAGPFDLGPNGIEVMEASTLKPKMFYPVEVGYARTARFSPDGKLLATAGQDCTVRVFDMGTMTNVFTDCVQATLFGLGFSPDGRYLVAGPSWGGVLLIYEVHTEAGKTVIKRKATSSRGEGEVNRVEFTPDGKHALFNSLDEGVQFWDAAEWASSKDLDASCGCLSADGKRIAVAREAAPSVVEVWEASSVKSEK